MDRTSRRDFLRNSALAAGALSLGAAAPPGASTSGAGTAAAGGAGAATVRGTQVPLKLARVWVTRETAHLISGFDDSHFVYDDGSVELLLWPGDVAELEATGLRYEITEYDVAARDAQARAASLGRPAGLDRQPGETEHGEYRTLEEHVADMQRLADENPDICELITLPFASLQGRPVYGLEIAEDVARKDGRPVFYNDGIHHSREWPAAEMPIMWAFDLIESYRRATDTAAEKQPDDERMANIVRNSRNVIVPVMNPDGFDYSRTGPAGTGRSVFDNSLTGLVPVAGMQYWRKNMRGVKAHSSVDPVNPGVEHLIPNNGIVPTTPGAVGVDPNRNYSYRWGGSGSSASQTSQTYRGDAPFSEPEAENVQWIHQRYQCIAGITHHTYGDLVLWAWGDTHADAPDDALLARLGFACGDYNGYRPTKSIDLYVTTGTCSDHIYGTFGSISYTFEHAGGSFHPPYEEVVPQFYANNRYALMLICELVCLEPHQRDFMHAALTAFDEPKRTTPYSIMEHLTGEFRENISNTDYHYPAENGLDLDGRYHCIIAGQLVNDGAPVAGTLRLTKSFDNPLSPNNPIGQATWPEEVDSVIETDADGNFRWFVYPSTRPALEFGGGKQSITLVAEADGATHEQELFLTRGDVVELGQIELT